MSGRAASDSPYLRLTLEQGSIQWHEFRRTVIGASDAPTIMGENPWKTVAALLMEKRGEGNVFAGNAKTRRGKALEPVARGIYVRERRIAVSPAVLHSKAFNWQAASVDGIDAAGSVVVEIKCGESAHELVTRTGQVPKYYYGQLQHILCVTGLEEIDYYSYLPETGGILLTVDRDEKYIERLVEAEERFWLRVKGTDSTSKFRRGAVTSAHKIAVAPPVVAPQTEGPSARWSSVRSRQDTGDGDAASRRLEEDATSWVERIPRWAWFIVALGMIKLLVTISRVT